MIDEIFNKFTKNFSLEYRDFIESKLDIIKYEFCTSNAYDQIVNDMLSSINNQLFDALVVEFHIFREDSKKNKNIDDLFNSYIEQIGTKKFKINFLKKYPILFNKIDSELKIKIDFVNKIFEHLDNDRQCIYDILGTKLDNDKVEEVEINMGDTHDGESVSIISFSNSKILYKPKEIGLEKMVASIIDLVAKSNYVNPKLTKNIIIPLRIEKGDYYWEEYIHSSGLKTSDELRSFYYIAGLYLGMFYILNIADIHFENIIFTEKAPVFIDLEVMNSHASMDELEQYSFNNSILTTALLPMFDEKLELNMSGLFSKEQTTEKLSYQVPKYDAELGITYETKSATIKPQSPKLNTKNKQQEASRKLIKGFSDCLYYINDNRSTVNDMLRDFKETECRILLRHTSVYFSFLQALNTPEYVTSEKKQEQLLQILEENYTPDIFGYVNVYEEIEQLKEGNIPKFYTFLNSTDLYARNNILIENYFNNKMFEIIDKRISSLNVEMIQYQINFIKLSLLSISKPNELETQYNSYLLSEYTNGNRNDLKTNVKNLITSIDQHSVAVPDGRKDYYSLYFGDEKSMKLNTAQFGLYTSSANILLYYVYGLKYEDDGAIKLAESLYKNLLYKFESLMEVKNIEGTINLSVFNGISSVLYISYFLYKYTQDKKYLEDAKQIYKSISNILDYQISTNKISLDFINGIAGIGVIFTKIFKDDEGFIKVDDIELIKEKLITHKYEIDDYGLAHGNLGIALFLIHYATDLYFNDEINSHILDFIEFDDIKNNKSWCRGHSGKLYVLHQYLTLLKKEKLPTRKISDEIISILENNDLLNMDSLSLCHGIFGNADILINLLNDINVNINNQKMKNEIDKLYINDLSKIRWQHFIDIPSDSYMTGATGVAYELMRIKDNQIPSIMLLDFAD